MRNKFYARAWSILRPLVMFFLPVELRGTENLGDEAAILCANHSSAWDPIPAAQLCSGGGCRLYTG